MIAHVKNILKKNKFFYNTYSFVARTAGSIYSVYSARSTDLNNFQTRHNRRTLGVGIRTITSFPPGRLDYSSEETALGASSGTARDGARRDALARSKQTAPAPGFARTKASQN